MDAIWQKLFTDANVSGIWIVVSFLLSSLIGYFSTRGASRDKSKSDVLKMTIDRQDALDKRQQSMMDDLQEEIRRVNVEMDAINREAAHQNKRNSTLSEKYTMLLQDNHALQMVIAQLQREKDDLTTLVKELAEKNAGFVEKIEQLTEEIRGKRA